MNKIFTLLLSLFVLLFQVTPAYAAIEIPGGSANIVVDFEQNPLFNEANFTPGKTVSRTVTVTNNTPDTQTIGTMATSVSDPDG
jgi:hypothetical protein